jgi:CHAT domain-containing protein/tetratricopeptide (TPR) repeat protein
MLLPGCIPRAAAALLRAAPAAIFSLICTVRAWGSVCPAAGNAAPLEAGVTLLSSLPAAGQQSYVLELPARARARIVVEQDAPDLSICIASPAGDRLRQARTGSAGEITVSFAALLPGSYRIVLRTGEAVPPAEPIAYRIRPEVTEANLSRDWSSFLAEQAFLKGQALRSQTPRGALRSALSQYAVARERWAKAGDTEGQARALLGVAAVLLDLGDYPHALAAYATAERLSAALPQARVKAMNGRTRVYLEKWDAAVALQSAEEALMLSRSLGNPRAEADALISRGEAQYLRTNDGPAKQDLETALVMARAEGDRFSIARALRALAWIEEDQGRMHNAASRMQEAEQIFRAIGDQRAAVNAIGDLATIESIQGDRYGALSTHMEVLRLLRKMGQANGQAFALAALGADYLRMNEHTAALEYFQQALRIFKMLDHASGEQDSMSQLCVAELAMDSLSSALQHCSESVRLVARLHDPKRQAISLKDLGAVEEALGHMEKAAALYQRAAELSHEVQDARFEATAIVSQGLLKARRGDQQSAILLYKTALSLSQAAETPDGEISARYEIARSEYALGLLEDAQRQLDSTIELAEGQRSKVGSYWLRSSYFTSIRKCYDLYVEILMARHGKDPNSGFDRMALKKTEASRARTLLDALAGPHSDSSAERDPNAAAQLRLLRARLAATYEERLKLMLENGGQQSMAENARRISLLSAEYNRATEATRGSHPVPTAPFPTETLDQTLRDLFDPQTVILEFLLGEEHSFAWRVEQDRVSSYVLPGRKTISEMVERWRSLVEARKSIPGETDAAHKRRIDLSDRELPGEARRLACTILGPLDGLEGGRLIVISDGVLDSLPFAALPLDGCSRVGGPPLITKYEVVNLPSILALDGLRRREKHLAEPAAGVAVVADPVFSGDDPRVKIRTNRMDSLAAPSALGLALRDVGWNRLPRLPATRREANAIAARTPALVALDFNANLKTVLSARLSRYRVLHLATHGLLDANHPELSGLVFSLVDENGHAIHGYLQAQEIYELNLHAELVVLSACSSGLGRQISGEGTVGLARAFMHAGSPRVISTLWSIEDDSTSELMSQFYDLVLNKKLSPAAALREAQLRLAKDKQWSSPFFWAGFVLTGEWR